MATKEQNLGFLDNATSTLDQIATNPSQETFEKILQI